MDSNFGPGARDELRDKMSDDGRRVFDYVRVCAGQGRNADHLTESVAMVFTADWPLHRRLHLAWRLVTRR